MRQFLFTFDNDKLKKFIIVGLIGVLVNESTLFLLTDKVGIYYLFSSIIAIQIAIINNFIFNNYWTFKERSHGSISRKFTKFETLSLIGAISNVIFLIVFVTIGLNYLIANLISIFLVFIFNFTGSSKWVWRK